MKLSLTDLPIGDGGLSPENIENFWREVRGSFEVRGRQQFREDQTDLINRAFYNDRATIITERTRDVAVLMPIAFAKVALKAVHLMENDRVRRAILAAKEESADEFVGLDDAWREEFGEELPSAATEAAG